MESRGDLRAAIDRSKLMIKISVFGAVISGVLGILVLILGVIKESFGGSDLLALAIVPLILSFIFSTASMIYGIMSNSASMEEEEKYLLSSRKENRLLNVEEDVRFTAGRAFANYKKFAPYVITVIAGLVILISLLSFNSTWNSRIGERVASENPLNAALIVGIFMFIAIFSGSFFAGQSRTASFRWLRPVGGWLIASFGVLFLAALSLVLAQYKIVGFDAPAAKVVSILYAVFGVELVISFIIEFYRPRTSVESNPLFESRLLALITEPGGVMRNLADALDYQFGFKVSGTWIYGFIERSLFPLLILWGALLWLSTAVYEVGPNELGIRERFGKVVSTTPLKSGIYVDLPWPFASINRISCDRLHSLLVGTAYQANTSKVEKVPEVVIWTKAHAANENLFLVAVEPQPGIKLDNDAATVAFVGINLPVQYRVRESQIMDYAYGNTNPRQALKLLSEEVVTKYLASCSLMNIMSDQRSQASEILKQEIQKQADAERLGIEIVAVNILDVHPPVEKVAPAFQDVIGAMEKREATILESKTYAATIVPVAESTASRMVQDAKSASFREETVAKAESQRFFKQLQSYQAMPSMFILNERLNLLEQDAADVRKFVISSSLQNEIYELNFEEKARLDLVDADIGTLVSN